EVETKVEELKKIKDSEDLESIKRHTQELNDAAQKIGQAIYQAQQQASQQPPTGEQAFGQNEQKAEEGQVVDDKADNK
ncbi:MAG: molecular chaperone DnaK, partial [Candidatus Buchananbacteria bacterium]